MRHDVFMEDVDYVGEPAIAPRAGSLLVAAPLLPDPFRRAVILLLEHDESGTLGVVLNQRTQVDAGTVLPAWRDYLTGGPELFQGGPVSLDTALGLGAADDEPAGFRRVAGALGVIDLDTPPAELAPHLVAVRIYAGYAGWSPGQLDGELEEGAWAVIEPTDPVADAFLADPDELWSLTLRRAGGTLSWWVHCPDDPSVN